MVGHDPIAIKINPCETLKTRYDKLWWENQKLRKVAEAAKRVMDAATAQPQDVKERNIALAFLDATLAELETANDR